MSQSAPAGTCHRTHVSRTSKYQRPRPPFIVGSTGPHARRRTPQSRGIARGAARGANQRPAHRRNATPWSKARSRSPRWGSDDVMVPRAQMVMIDVDDDLPSDPRNRGRFGTLALPRARRGQGRDPRHPAGEGPAAPQSGRRARHARAAAPGGDDSRIDAAERAAGRIPPVAQPHGAGGRRIRRRGRPGHHRGRARGDRRRDRRRTRRRGSRPS